MVMHNTLLLGILVFVLRGTFCLAQSTSTGHGASVTDNRDRMAQAAMLSVSPGPYETPLRTCEAFVASLLHADFQRYLDCLSDQLREDFVGDDKLTEARINTMNETFRRAGYEDAVLHSILLDFEGDAPRLSIILSAERGAMRIKEQLDAQIGKTKDGWKVIRLRSKTLERSSKGQSD